LKFGVLQFPGSCDEVDALAAARRVGDAELIWHRDRSLGGADAIIVPGGFSYGDYLRTGAIARFSPVMRAVGEFARRGGPVLGICNGFQILQEAGLLPGAMLRNRGVQFLSQPVHVRVERTDTPATAGLAAGTVLTMPIAHGEGNFYAAPDEVARLEGEGQIVFRYTTRDGRLEDAANVNGSAGAIAGVCNAARNVVGLMPHPERASEAELGSEDGRQVFEALVRATGRVLA
jgi:phosphoribosylformylglycinamidine synthase subunit PurQ / glutaminase